MPKYTSDIDLLGNEIKGAKFEEVSSFPSNPFVGQTVLYKPSELAPAFNYTYDGSQWVCGVTSLEGLQGPLTKEDLDLDAVDNTSDVDKPISTATQSALDDKQPLDSDLTQIANLTPSNGDLIQRVSGAWTNVSVPAHTTKTITTATYNVLPEDDMIFIDYDGRCFLYLPNTSTVTPGKVFTFKCIRKDGRLYPYGTNKLETKNESMDMPKMSSRLIVSDGTDWWIL